jgi:hypothetical protein
MRRRQPVFLCFGLDSIDSAQASSSLTLLRTSNTVKTAFDFPGLGNNNLEVDAEFGLRRDVKSMQAI